MTSLNKIVCASAAALLVSSGAAFAKPRIETLVVKPGKGTDFEFIVTIERPTPLDIQKCEVSVDLGDGTKPLLISFNVGDKRTKSNRHAYAKPGTYKVRASGAGPTPCDGAKETSVTVAGAPGAKAAAAAPACPSGWSVVADSVKGNRYTCQANAPAKPLACAEGTKYFSEKGLIGCK